ncbi:MAG: thiamine pyrophosphate-dependent dehydrogenase E1 component subunit alpha [Elusimicrobiota bacterium]
MDIRRLYRSAYRIRRVEEEVARVYPTDKVKSPVHLSIGQEAVSVGLCEALRPTDTVFGTYRGHALYLAKGGDLKRMMAELYGKATGCSKGKGGSMHLVDTAAGMMGTSAIVGMAVPQAVGYAMACAMRKRDVLTVAVFGDGAMDEGVLGESLNFAALKKVPVLFVCENNLYAVHSRVEARHAKDLCAIPRAYGIPARSVDGSDAVAVYKACRRAAASAPSFVECRTYRWREHVGPNEDYDKGYRTRREARPWFKRDPVQLLARRLDAGVREGLEREVEAEIAEAFRFAEESPFPGPQELLTDAY